MPVITVTSTVTTRFDVPEGVTIEQVRHLALPTLSEDEDCTDTIGVVQEKALNQVYLGAADARSMTVEHKITEGAD